MSAQTDAIEAAILENASNPREVRFGNRAVVQQSVRDLIEAENYLIAKATAQRNRPGFGLRFQKIIPPGGG